MRVRELITTCIRPKKNPTTKLQFTGKTKLERLLFSDKSLVVTQ